MIGKALMNLFTPARYRRPDREKLSALVDAMPAARARAVEAATQVTIQTEASHKRLNATIHDIDKRIEEQEKRKAIRSPQIAAAMHAIELLRG